MCIASIASLFIMATTLSGLDDIAAALQSGDAKKVTAYFDKMVEMQIHGKEGTYSKAQAEQVLKNFFANNKPLQFKFEHNGTSGGNNAYYAIGTLKTDTQKFRVSLYLKKNNDTFSIQELTIEDD
jgi:hypothetical protein